MGRIANLLVLLSCALCGCSGGDLASRIDISTAREGQLEDKVTLLEDRIQQIQVDISQLKFTIVQLQAQIQHH